MRHTINQDGGCIVCGAHANDPHECFGGRNRQLSIKYGLVVAVCRTCHRKIHDYPKCFADHYVKQIGKKEFEKNYPDLDFIKIFY